jgi:lipoprotein-releasing system permease protein
VKLPLKIAWRYLFSKKKHNAINIISAISVSGIALATLTLVCTLSVFNGFQESVASFFTSFDAELKIVSTTGKTFSSNSQLLNKISNLPEVELQTTTLEENAMVKYKELQTMITLKGVDDNFHKVTSINTLLFGQGKFILYDEVVNYGIMGGELASSLSTGIHHIQPLEIFAPKPGAKINMSNPSTSFNTSYLYSPGVIFSVGQQKYDGSYILCSLKFAQDLLEKKNQISAIELKLIEGASIKQVKEKLAAILGQGYTILDRYEQQTDVFNIMKIEKLISFFFLIFILLIACFNIVSSLSMLIIEKRDDMQILMNIGADKKFIAKIFLYEGRLITAIGTGVGLVLGVILTLLQEHFGFIRLNDGFQFITSAYPVSLQLTDLLLIIVTVIVVGFISVWYPIQYLSKKILR